MDIKRTKENASKFLYLVGTYPEKSLTEIINLFQLPPIETNCAIWYLQDNKFIDIEQRKKTVDDLDKDGKKVGEKEIELPYGKILKTPKRYEFGDHVADLKAMLTYAFEHINKDEKDMEENYLANWTGGFFPQDVLIAVKSLIDDGVLHEYEIEDGENAYIFYTLAKNAGKNWGAKQFKTNPLTGEDQTEPTADTTE